MDDINKEFLDYINNQEALKVNEQVQGEVLEIDKDKFVVGLINRGGVEGIVNKREFTNQVDQDLNNLVKIGDIFDLTVIKLPLSGQENGMYTLSYRRQIQEKAWKENSFAVDQTVTGTVIDAIRGGLLVDVQGINAFMPNSLIDQRFVKNLKSFIGKEVVAKIIEYDPENHRMVISRKDAQESVDEQKQQLISDKVKVGDIIEGKVVKIADFGAFVNILDDVDGLVHISELDQNKVNKVEDVVKIGDIVKAKVLEVDPAKKRIALSIKQTQPSNWDKVATDFSVNQEVEGTVQSIQSFGAFVQLLPGVDGLIHNNHLKEKLEVGDRVTVKIIDINPEERRIALSTEDN